MSGGADKPVGISVVLADDHRVLREGLRLLLQPVPGLAIAGEAGDGIEALRLVESVRPDVVVVDLLMPGTGGLEVTREVVRRRLPTRVLVLSMYAEPSYVRDAFRLGALGYLVKGCSADELVEAIREVAGGRRFLGESLRRIDLRLESPGVTDPYESLTPREHEVLQLLAEGYTNAKMGRRLFISARTVETHRANLMRKLGLRNQSEVVRYALSRGLLPR